MSEEIPLGPVVSYKVANRARNELHTAVKKGTVVRQPCRDCGTTERIEAHHPDYTRPLDVIWLCREHHEREHHGRIRRTMAIRGTENPEHKIENMQTLMTTEDKRRIVWLAEQEERTISDMLRILILESLKIWEASNPGRKRRLP